MLQVVILHFMILDRLKNSIFHTPWHLMRWVRLVAGGWAILNFIKAWSDSHLGTMEFLLLGAGIYFLYKALFNTGCEVGQNYTEQHIDETTTIDCEEIK